MEVISKIPNQQVLRKGYKKFNYNFFKIILTILLFPLVLFYSRKYIKKFLEFCFAYQRSGDIIIDGQLVDFNSFSAYHGDCSEKKLTNCLCCYVDFSKENFQELNISNAKQEKISCLVVTHSKKTTKWVIGLHGWTENKYLALRLVSWFYQQGYNVLTFDSVAHGQSYGQYTDIGLSAAEDLIFVVRWLRTNYQVDSIGLIGNSMGASTAYFYALKYYDQEKVNWVIADSGFANLLVQYRFVMQYRYHKPWWLISFGLNKVYKTFTKSKIKDYNLLSNSSLQVPVLLIHGHADTFVPFFMGWEIYQQHLRNGSTNFDCLFLEKINHIESLFKSHSKYIEKVYNFISKNDK